MPGGGLSSLYMKLNKTNKDGQRYRLVSLGTYFIIYKDSMATGHEAEFSDKIAEFRDENKALAYWNKIK